MANELDAKHHAFTNWARAQGVTINGVTPAQLPGKGFGIVATRNLKVSNAYAHMLDIAKASDLGLSKYVELTRRL
jgi:hypothetical protein